VILVSDEELKESMALFLKAIDVLVEGAGAAALAGALKMKKELSNKSVCLIASESNVDKDLRQDIITNYAN
jgi:threonine dehydratase